jgi:hypothetical protein
MAMRQRRRIYSAFPEGMMKSYTWFTGVSLALSLVVAPAANAQWVTTYEQFYLQAGHNWQFRDRYQAADRLFNAFDFGHAILYETLWTKPSAPPSELEERWYDRLTKQILVKPPRVPLEEGAIEIRYVQLVPEAKAMFEWAHILHRQLYDVLADERLSQQRKDAEIARLVAYYKTRGDLAFSSSPKSMALMQEQPYSLAFRKNYPKFNGLIWAYHWLQVGLYEPLLVYSTPEARQAGVRATVARFWQMLDSVPAHMPHLMPMTPAVAPVFAARYPEAAIIFDNLHSMHDVVSDILANPSVPRHRKRAEILVAARRFRDDTSFVLSPDAWRNMAAHMGIENMGGPSVGFLPALPTPTVSYGAVMTHDERTGAMTGFSYGRATGGDHSQHATTPAPRDSAPKAADPHAGHTMPARPDSTPPATPVDSAAGSVPASGENMMELHMRLLGDPVIRGRIVADSALRRRMLELIREMPAEHRGHMESLLTPPPAAVRSAPATRAKAPPATRTTKAAPAAKAPTKSAPTKAKTKTAPATKTKAPDPHAGHKPPP